MVGESLEKRKASGLSRNSHPQIHRIGWFTASCLLISNIIGGGIFTTTGLMARDLGDPFWILMLWGIGGLFAIGGAMVYGELGSRLPHAGGDYVYLREAYGPLVAFLSGWTSFTIGFGAAVAASALSFSSYALRVIPLAEEQSWTATALSLSLLWVVTLIHCNGVKSGGLLQRLITSMKVVAIGGLIVGGLFADAAQWDRLTERSAAASPSPAAANACWKRSRRRRATSTASYRCSNRWRRAPITRFIRRFPRPSISRLCLFGNCRS